VTNRKMAGLYMRGLEVGSHHCGILHTY
jgi:hypothetical protein